MEFASGANPAETEYPGAALKLIADEVRSWPSWLRTSTSVANSTRPKEPIVSQREAIAEVQQQLYDKLIAPVEHGSMRSDDDADVLIRQADAALGLAWKLADPSEVDA